MVKHNSSSRFSFIKTQVFLTQTDTTVGFLSQDATQLQYIKSRSSSKPFIKVFATFKDFQKNNRIPKRYKSRVRRSKKTTFIVKNQAFRVVPYPLSVNFMQKIPWFFSTSANERGKHFDRRFCEAYSDIIIEDKNSLKEGKASQLYKLNNTTKKRLR